MARPKTLKNSLVVSLRIESDEYYKLQDLAALETINTGRKVTTLDLIRYAIEFVYGDNERLRESFRRTRGPINRFLKQKT